jgi:hypothetical protein
LLQSPLGLLLQYYPYHPAGQPLLDLLDFPCPLLGLLAPLGPSRQYLPLCLRGLSDQLPFFQ